MEAIADISHTPELTPPALLRKAKQAGSNSVTDLRALCSVSLDFI